MKGFVCNEVAGFQASVLLKLSFSKFIFRDFVWFVFSFPLVSQYCSYVFVFNFSIFLDCAILGKCLYAMLSVAGKNSDTYTKDAHE